MKVCRKLAVVLMVTGSIVLVLSNSLWAGTQSQLKTKALQKEEIGKALQKMEMTEHGPAVPEIVRMEPAIEESDHLLSGLVGFSTEGYEGGLQITDGQPMVEGDLRYTYLPFGIYAGIYGSNIAGDSFGFNEDFEEVSESGSVEIDFYTGYETWVGSFGLNFEVMYSHLPNDLDSGLRAEPGYDTWMVGEAEADSWIFHVGLDYTFDLDSFLNLTFWYDFIPDSFGDGKEHDFTVLLTTGLPYDFYLVMLASYTNVEGIKQTGKDSTGFGYGLGYDGINSGEAGYDFRYYEIGLSREFFGLTFDLSYHFGNSAEDYFTESTGSSDLAADRLVFTLSYFF